MNIWCPECGSFHFNFSPVGGQNSELGPMYKDQLTCKSCNYSFTIEWLEPERKWWMLNNMKSERPKFTTKKYGYKNRNTQNAV